MWVSPYNLTTIEAWTTQDNADMLLCSDALSQTYHRSSREQNRTS